MPVPVSGSHTGRPDAPASKRRLVGIVVTASIATALFLGEGMVRLRVGVPLRERLPLATVRANRLRGWEMLPNSVHYTYEHKVMVNALGLRGSEIDLNGTAGRVVLALWDSLVYGQGVSDQETIPFWMERALNQRAGWCPCTVINAGHRAYSTNQELGLLKELGPKLKPSVVVLFWFWNDLEESNIQRSYASLLHSGPVAFDLKARAEGWPAWKWRGLQLLRRSALLMWLHEVYRRMTANYPSASQVDAGLEKLTLHLREFRTLSQQSQFTFVLAVIPDPNSLLAGHPTDRINRRVAEIARNQGIPVVELLPPLRVHYRQTGKLPVIPYDGHYTSIANDVIAQTVVEVLSQTLKLCNSETLQLFNSSTLQL